MTRRALPVLVAALVLGGCASGVETIQVPREVLVQVPVACVDQDKRPAAPQRRSASDLLAMDRYRRTLAVWSELHAERAYAGELEAVVEGCARIPARPP